MCHLGSVIRYWVVFITFFSFASWMCSNCPFVCLSFVPSRLMSKCSYCIVLAKRSGDSWSDLVSVFCYNIYGYIVTIVWLYQWQSCNTTAFIIFFFSFPVRHLFTEDLVTSPGAAGAVRRSHVCYIGNKRGKKRFAAAGASRKRKKGKLCGDFSFLT